ncbi:MAG: hypothetical protein WBW76_09140, partial [Candidatus Cybelea sp.]
IADNSGERRWPLVRARIGALELASQRRFGREISRTRFYSKRRAVVENDWFSEMLRRTDCTRDTISM